VSPWVPPTAVVLLLALGGCTTGALAAADVATAAEKVLAQQSGVRGTVTCPEDLEDEVGAEIRCTLTAGDDPAQYGVRIRVTSVDAHSVRFDVAVDRQPAGH
jgi:hypothetical protein